MAAIWCMHSCTDTALSRSGPEVVCNISVSSLPGKICWDSAVCMASEVAGRHQTRDGKLDFAAQIKTAVITIDVSARAPPPTDHHHPRSGQTRYAIRSKIIVAWIRSPPPRPLLPDAAVVMVWSR